MSNKVKISVILTFIAMVVVNALANILPINGVATGEISDFYANLFAPAGITFSIWGLIYLLLAAYSVFQSGIIKNNNTISKVVLNKVGITFCISSIANILWIFSWHYQIIYLSMILMIIILICLIQIVNIIRKQKLTVKQKIFVKLPFSVYFGWITVATIANVTTLLVSLGWNGFGIPQATWAVIIIAVGAVIGILTILKNKDYIYGLVIAWAYIGILIKHLSANGFNSMYPQVIITVIVCLVLVAAANVYALVKKAY